MKICQARFFDAPFPCRPKNSVQVCFTLVLQGFLAFFALRASRSPPAFIFFETSAALHPRHPRAPFSNPSRGECSVVKLLQSISAALTRDHENRGMANRLSAIVPSIPRPALRHSSSCCELGRTCPPQPPWNLRHNPSGLPCRRTRKAAFAAHELARKIHVLGHSRTWKAAILSAAFFARL